MKLPSFLKNPHGFTLIELMVAITILVIASAIGIASYSQAQKVARDARRKSDLYNISVALELYKQNNGHYPTYKLFNCGPNSTDFDCSVSDDWEFSTESTCSSWIHEFIGTDPCGKELVPDYISPIPLDPINADDPIDGVNGYRTHVYRYKTNGYVGCPGDGRWYVLAVNLENEKDSDAVGNKFAQGKPVKWCDGTVLPGDGTHFVHSNAYMIIQN